MTMGKKRSYVHCGSKSGLEQVLPGVRVHVLGPPTVDQTDKIKKQRSSDPHEFWQLQARSIGTDEAISGGEAALFPRHVEARGARFPSAPAGCAIIRAPCAGSSCCRSCGCWISR